MAKLNSEQSRSLGEQNKFLRLMREAMSGDLAWDASPSSVSATAGTSQAWTRTITVSLKNTSGDVHEWFNESYTSKVSAAHATEGVPTDTTSATLSVGSANLVFVRGVASISVSGTAGTWPDNMKDTCTIANISVIGSNLATITSVEHWS